MIAPLAVRRPVAQASSATANRPLIQTWICPSVKALTNG